MPVLPPRTTRVAALGLLCLMSACADRRAADAVVVRDSAGVRIVENTPADPSAPAPLQLGDEPEVVLAAGADEVEPLYRVRAASRLADGGILVANGGASQLRLHGPDGTLRRVVGRAGGGPGEFRNLLWAAVLPGDSVLAFDGQSRRFTLFDTAGAVARAYGPEDASLRRALGLVRAGVLVTVASLTAGGRMPSGVTRDTARIALLAADGTLGEPIARLPGDERVISISPGGVNVVTSPFARRLTTATDADGFWALHDGGYEIGRYALDGRLERLVRLAGTGRLATPALLEAHVARVTAGIPDAAMRRSTAAALRALPLPARLPMASRLVTDAAGRLWAQDFVAADDGAATWRVFDREGRYAGVVATSPRFTVHEIGRDYVLGVLLGEDDEEEVRLYRLDGGASPGGGRD